MSLPGSSDPVWKQIVTGQKKIAFEYLATQIFIGRVQMEVANDPSRADSLATELYELFKKGENHPTVQKDLAKL